MDLNAADVHPDHFLEGARDLVLHIATDLPAVDVLSQDETQVGGDHVILDLDPYPIPTAAFEEPVYTPRHLRHAADARDAQSRAPGNGDKNIRRNCRFAW